MAPDFVSVRDLVFDYGTKRALDAVSFDIEAGAVIALVGPNGAGKTTLLRCLATLEQPRAAHRKLGFQQDFFGVYDSLSVTRNLLHAAALQGLPETAIDTAVTWAAGAVGLADRMGELAGALSRGLRQRLAIARAMVHRPPLLLLDEPASGLDPEARRDLSALIRTLRAEGLTIIVSSHILAELEDYSTHMLTLREGRASGPVALDGEHAAGMRRWRLTVAGPIEPALAVLIPLAGVADAREDNGAITFTLAGDEAAQSELLRGLIQGGVAVSSCAPANGHLETLYLAEKSK